MEEYRFFEVDGSQKSGSGTILRLSVALSAITKKPLHIYNIRNNRPKPGLKPQHLEAVKTAGKLCRAKIHGAKMNSKELWFIPYKNIGGNFTSSIGTAGSISALILTVLPICVFADNPVRLCITKGGTDVSNSPTINYMKFILLNILKKMGIQASIKINRYGYYPKGMGEVILKVNPSVYLKPIILDQFGKVCSVNGISVSTFLSNRKVAERQAIAARDYLSQNGYSANIKSVYDTSNPIQKGSSIVIWAKTSTGVIVGADAIGAIGKSSEEIGKEAAKKLNVNIKSRATVDLNLSDMLVTFMALTKEKSTFFTRILSEHLETNIWLVEKLLDIRFKVKKIDNLYQITKNA